MPNRQQFSPLMTDGFSKLIKLLPHWCILSCAWEAESDRTNEMAGVMCSPMLIATHFVGIDRLVRSYAIEDILIIIHLSHAYDMAFPVNREMSTSREMWATGCFTLPNLWMFQAILTNFWQTTRLKAVGEPNIWWSNSQVAISLRYRNETQFVMSLSESLFGLCLLGFRDFFNLTNLKIILINFKKSEKIWM
jgi:hypothetical protein